MLTGAGGRIARVLRPELAARVGRLRLVDLVAIAPEHPGEESAVADLRDQAAVEAALAGADGVLHLGAIADEADFHDLADVNIVGTFHVLEAARRHGIGRVLIASSNHVTGLYPTAATIGPELPVRPDGLYAVSKVAGEALGRLYAEKFGLGVACLRIGSFELEPRETRHVATWLSPADALAAFVAAMTAPGLGYAVFYASSRNARGWWDLGAGEALGFDPHDDGERWAGALGAPERDGGAQGGPHATVDATRAWLTDRSRA